MRKNIYIYIYNPSIHDSHGNETHLHWGTRHICVEFVSRFMATIGMRHIFAGVIGINMGFNPCQKVSAFASPPSFRKLDRNSIPLCPSFAAAPDVPLRISVRRDVSWRPGGWLRRQARAIHEYSQRRSRKRREPEIGGERRLREWSNSFFTKPGWTSIRSFNVQDATATELEGMEIFERSYRPNNSVVRLNTKTFPIRDIWILWIFGTANIR